MGLAKKILRHNKIQGAAAWIIAGYIRLVHATARFEMEMPPDIQSLLDDATPFVGCFWHGRLLMMPCIWPKNRPMHVLISSHADGQLISRSIAHFGLSTVAGSSRRGGMGAVRVLLRMLRNGETIAITPDGPLGPRMRAQAGVAALAQMAGLPVLTVSYCASHAFIIRSWDSFMLALPFSRIRVRWGAALRMTAEESTEDFRLRIEATLNELAIGLDREMGRKPVLPAGAAP